jgi:sulfide dehydrogenase cytochrome subunit
MKINALQSCLSAATLIAASALPVATHAQNANAVRGMAATCANCHGTDGRSVGTVAGLAGMDKGYIVQQMQAFKAGKPPATIMHQLAKGYSDAQIEQLAAYFAALKKSP